MIMGGKAMEGFIEKEHIAGLYFPKDEVLSTVEEIEERRADAERTTFLGNGYRGKVTIYFRDSKGLKQVETTVWEVTDTLVMLKDNLSIPLHRIIKFVAPSESLKYPNI